MIWYMFAFYGSPPPPSAKKKAQQGRYFFEVSGREFTVLLLQCKPSTSRNGGQDCLCLDPKKVLECYSFSFKPSFEFDVLILDDELWICEILKTKQKHTDDNSAHLHSNPFISLIVLQALHEAWAFEDREVIQACIVMVLEAEDFQVMLQPCMSKKWWVSETIFSLKQWHLP